MIRRLAIFVRDLLQQPEGTVVVIGRHNMRRDDFTALQIVVDRISPELLTSQSKAFDGEAETTTITSYFEGPNTLNFYGDGARAEAIKFIGMLSSQAGYELQRDQTISVYNMTGLTDVKLLAGSQYSERQEMVFNVRYSESLVIDTLRIDTANGTILTDNPIGTETWQTSAI